MYQTCSAQMLSGGTGNGLCLWPGMQHRPGAAGVLLKACTGQECGTAGLADSSMAHLVVTLHTHLLVSLCSRSDFGAPTHRHPLQVTFCSLLGWPGTPTFS